MRIRVLRRAPVARALVIVLTVLNACTSGQDLTTAPAKAAPPQSSPSAPSNPTPPGAPPTASAALGTPAQTIKGWGMYPAGNGGLYGRSQVAAALYGSGITFFRVQFRPELYASGTTLANMTLDPGALNVLVQSIQQAQSYGLSTYIGGVWSPPAVWKTNGSLVGGGLIATDETAYIAYLTKILQALKANGAPLPVAISIQNEPEHLDVYSTAIYSTAQWQRVIQATRAAFDANGLSAVKLFGPETGTFNGPIWEDPTTRAVGYFGGSGYPALGASTALNSAVGAYALHAYGECVITQNAAGMQAFPKDAWMTEFSAPNGTTETDWMIDTYRALAAHLATLPFNYWAWWNGFAQSSTSPDGGSLLGGDQTPIYSKRFYALKQLWTTVRPGWKVVPMTTTDPDLQVGVGAQDPCAARVDLLAFVSPDAKTVAILMTNTTKSNKVLGVTGLPGTGVYPYRSDAANDMTPQAAVPITKGTANIPLPAGSAVLAIAN